MFGTRKKPGKYAQIMKTTSVPQLTNKNNNNNDCLARQPLGPSTPPILAPLPSEPLLSKEEVAAHCQVSLRTVDYWMKRGALKFLKLGFRVRFSLSDVE